MVRFKEKSAPVCEPLNECTELADPCNGGRCIESTSGYVCDCVTGRGGPTCAERRSHQEAAAYINISALLIIIASVVLLLCKYLMFVSSFSYSPFSPQEINSNVRSSVLLLQLLMIISDSRLTMLCF
jgi:hypothetical protein